MSAGKKPKDTLAGAADALKELAKLQLRIEELEAENSDLRQERDAMRLLIDTQVSVDGSNITFPITKEEMIAHRQLEVLNGASQGRELTMEEAKKVEIYSKIVASLRPKDKKPTTDLGAISEADLLKAVDPFSGKKHN